MNISPLESWIRNRIAMVPDSVNLGVYHADKLRALVTRLKNSGTGSFYRRKLAGFEPESIVSAEDIAAWPFTTPAELADDGPLMVCVPQDEVSRVVTITTTGTTGNPKRLWFSEADLEQTRDFFRCGMGSFTAEGDRVLIGMPGQLPASVGDLLREAIGRLGAAAVICGPFSSLEHTASLIKRKGVNVIVALPRQAAALASYMYKNKIEHRLKAVLLSADYVPRPVPGRIENLLGCRVFDHYGMTETGYGGGVFCEDFSGYHMREADLYIEIIDPASGMLLPDGCWGELVFTTLTRTAMPLFRYRTGDISRRLPGRCGCGSVLPLYDRIAGRLDDYINTGERYVARTDFEDWLFSDPAVLDYEADFETGRIRVFRLEGMPPDYPDPEAFGCPWPIDLEEVRDYSFGGRLKGRWHG